MLLCGLGMRLGVATLLLAWLVGCKFDSAPLVNKATSHPATKSGSSSHPVPAMDGGADSAARDAASPPAVPADAATAGPSDAGAVDSGRFGSDPKPHDPPPPPQSGGLECNGEVCPFASDPIAQCCTSQDDVDQGAARATDRCGLDFSATGADFFGGMCWQRDQAGVVDDNCPPVAVDLHTQDPGCCSDEGLCGGVDSANGLGCHYDPGAPSQPCGAVGDDNDGGVSCDPLGVFALRMRVDMAWGGRSGGLAALTDDGRGSLVMDLLANVDGIDPATHELHGTLKPCGVELPAFYSTTLCEAYQPVFPTAMWESSAMPQFNFTGHTQCLQPGCIESIDAQTVLIGIELSNPEAPWPTAGAQLSCPSGSGAQCFPDHDGDGLPGVTVQVATSGVATGGTGCSNKYANKGAPLSASPAAIIDGVRRTDRISIGVRMKLGGSVKLGDSCDQGRGSGIAEFVNSRAIGCMVEPGTYNFPFGFQAAGPNQACQASEASFMDANLPLYTILAVGQAPDAKLKLADTSASPGPLVGMVRLGPVGAAASCADVRAASFP